MIRLELATSEDIDAVAKLHAEAASWLASKGSDQWQATAVGRKTPDRVRRSIAKHVAAQECWVALDGDEVVGTITIDSYADPEFWTEDDEPHDALYVHRMIVKRERAGEGIGDALLGLANVLAAKAGRRWVRLDAWSTNEDLHAYYRRAGFQHVRTLRYAHRGSGALFQRAVPQVRRVPGSEISRVKPHPEETQQRR
jgi:ribosomal protein S18 acetylase RimI-like enzyme